MRSIAIYNTYIARSAALLAMLCTLSVFLYGIFLLMAVEHTAARSEAQRQIETVSAHVSDMEMRYLSLQRSLTPERAQALGLVTPSEVSTVYATAATRSLTINANR